MSAQLLRDVVAARDDHDKTCVYGGKAVAVHFNPADAERLSIEEGEDLCGLRAKHDEKVPLGRLRVYCDVELDGAGPVLEDARGLPMRASPAYSPTPVPA